MQEYSFVVIQHAIRSQYWERETPELASRYFSFWDDFGTAKSLTQFLIFLTVVYARRAEDFSRPVDPERVKRQVQRDLRKLIPQRRKGAEPAQSAELCPRLLMEELSCVKFQEVDDWLASSTFSDLFPSAREQAEKIFAAPPGGLAHCKAIGEIEDYIEGMLHQQFNPVR